MEDATRSSNDEWRMCAELCVRSSPAMLMVGIYSTETFEPLAVVVSTDNDHNATVSFQNTQNDQNGNCDSKTATKAMQIAPNQVRAIVTHIRTPDNVLMKVNIADLDFLCLRQGTGCMVGMSNFNMDATADAVSEADQTLFSITRRHYTSQLSSKEGIHALKISAILKEDIVVIGLCLAGDHVSLNSLKRLIKVKEDGNIDKIIAAENKTNNAFNGNNFSNVEQTHGAVLNSTPFIGRAFDVDIENNNENGETVAFSNVGAEAPKVNLRRSMKSDEEKRHDKLKRETEFCEDWRSATIRSIEALRNIGPFNEGGAVHDDDDRVPLIVDTDVQLTGIDNVSGIGIDDEDQHVQDAAARRPSRATMV